MVTNNLQYPVNSVPPLMFEAGANISEKLKCADEIIGQAMQAVVSAAVQSQIEVDVPVYGVSPTNLWFLTAAGSAEGKDSVSRVVREGVDRFSNELMEVDQDAANLYSAKIDTWAAERDGLKKQLSAQVRRGEDTEEIKILLTEHHLKKPIVPKNHCLVLDCFDEKTFINNLSSCSKFVYIESTEGASVLNKKAIRNIPWLIKSFSGESIIFSYGAPKMRTHTVRGALSSMNVMIQPKVISDLLKTHQSTLIESGFIPRFLPAYPQERCGRRFLIDGLSNFEGVNKFNSRVYDVLNESSYFRTGSDEKITMVFSPQARLIWIDVRNEIESAMAPGRGLFSVREFAGRVANNVARMAANWQYFQYGNAEISAATLSATIEMCKWHAFEFMRMFSDDTQLLEPEEDAVKLEAFLRDSAVRRNIWQWPILLLQQSCPRPIRYSKLRLMNALAILENQCKVTRLNNGAGDFIQLTTYFNCAPNFNAQLPLMQYSRAI